MWSKNGTPVSTSVVPSPSRSRRTSTEVSLVLRLISPRASVIAGTPSCGGAVMTATPPWRRGTRRSPPGADRDAQAASSRAGRSRGRARRARAALEHPGAPGTAVRNSRKFATDGHTSTPEVVSAARRARARRRSRRRARSSRRRARGEQPGRLGERVEVVGQPDPRRSSITQSGRAGSRGRRPASRQAFENVRTTTSRGSSSRSARAAPRPAGLRRTRRRPRRRPPARRRRRAAPARLSAGTGMPGRVVRAGDADDVGVVRRDGRRRELRREPKSSSRSPR
jgi:hypothetical protein